MARFSMRLLYRKLVAGETLDFSSAANEAAGIIARCEENAPPPPVIWLDWYRSMRNRTAPSFQLPVNWEIPREGFSTGIVKGMGAMAIAATYKIHFRNRSLGRDHYFG